MILLLFPLTKNTKLVDLAGFKLSVYPILEAFSFPPPRVVLHPAGGSLVFRERLMS